CYDPVAISRAELQPRIATLIASGLKADMKSRRVPLPCCSDDPELAPDPPGPHPCCYGDPEFAPDLAEVAERTKKTPEQVIAGHLASPFKVYALGFMPGFAYSAGLEPSLYLPRRSH